MPRSRAERYTAVTIVVGVIRVPVCGSTHGRRSSCSSHRRMRSALIAVHGSRLLAPCASIYKSCVENRLFAFCKDNSTDVAGGRWRSYKTWSRADVTASNNSQATRLLVCPEWSILMTTGASTRSPTTPRRCFLPLPWRSAATTMRPAPEPGDGSPVSRSIGWRGCGRAPTHVVAAGTLAGRPRPRRHGYVERREPAGGAPDAGGVHRPGGHRGLLCEILDPRCLFHDVHAIAGERAGPVGGQVGPAGSSASGNRPGRTSAGG